MKKLFLLILCGCRVLESAAQLSISTVNNGMFNNSASSYFPSFLGSDFEKWQLETSTFAQAGSSGVPFGTLKKFAFDTYITTDELKYYYSQLQSESIISGKIDAQFFSFAMKFPLNEINQMAMSFTVRDRFMSDFFFSRNFADLMLDGNAQFAGVNTEIGTPGINSLYYREFAVGSSFILHDVDFNSEQLNNTLLQIGGRIKFLSGLAVTDMPRNSAMLYTDPDGRYIDLSIDQEMNYAGFQSKETSFGYDIPVIPTGVGDLKATGKGAAIDLGFTYSCNKVHKMSIGITDLGFLTFRNVTTNTVQGDYHFEGIEVDNILTDLIGDTLGGADNYIEGQSTTGGKMSATIPSQLNLQYEYIIDQSGLSGFFGKGVAFGTYTHRLNKATNTVSTGFLTAGYALWMKDFAVLGANISLGGYEHIGFGTFAAGRIGMVKLGIGTSDILSLFSTETYHGASVTANLGVTF